MGGAGVQVRVWWTHQDVQPEELRGWTVAVVDCLRATTTIAAALAAGATAVLPEREEDLARRTAAARGAVLAGERACVPPPGFDLGNSPGTFTPAVVSGREVVLWTTNGSQALGRAPAVDGELLAFALVNVGATAAYLRRRGCTRLAIVCAGTEGAFSLEDAFSAGALIERLAAGGPDVPELEARASVADLLHRCGRTDPVALLAGGGAATRLRRVGLEEDVAWAARVDALPVVTAWYGGALRRAAGA